MYRQTSQALSRLQSRKEESVDEDPKKDMERLKMELEQEGASKASLFGIIKYARPEWIHLFVGFVSCCVQGCVFPCLALVFAQMIKVKNFNSKIKATNSDLQLYRSAQTQTRGTQMGIRFFDPRSYSMYHHDSPMLLLWNCG